MTVIEGRCFDGVCPYHFGGVMKKILIMLIAIWMCSCGVVTSLSEMRSCESACYNNGGAKHVSKFLTEETCRCNNEATFYSTDWKGKHRAK